MGTETTTKVATFIRKLEGWRGDARLYRMEPPHEGSDYVIASAVMASMSGPETYLFPANAAGEVESYGEMDGSQRGTLRHEDALTGAGYTVARSLTDV